MNHIYSILFFLLIIISPSISHSSKENCQPSHQPVLTPLHDKQNYYGISSAAFVSHKPDYQEIEQAKDRAIKDLSYTQHLKSPFYEVRTRAIGVVEKQDFQAYATDTCYVVSHEKRRTK